MAQQYTPEQYRKAARKAHAAGDTAAAKRLIAAGRAAEAAAPPKDYRGEGGGRGTGLEAFGIGLRQGVTFGFGDEINAGVRAAGDWMRGEDFGESYDKRLEHERGLLAQTRDEDAGASLAGEVGGALLVPGLGTAAGGVRSGAAAGAGMGLVSGFGEGEGGARKRGRNAVRSALLGGALGGGAGAAGRALRGRNTRKGIEETVAALEDTKEAGYKQLAKSNVEVTPRSSRLLGRSIRATAHKADADEVLNPRATRMVDKAMERGQGAQSLREVERTRRAIGRKVAGAPDPDEAYIGVQMKGAVDRYLDKLDASDLANATPQQAAEVVEGLKDARAANTKLSKHKAVTEALTKAENRAATGGTGGNEVNTMRQNIRSILDSPAKRRGFTPAERDQMTRVVRGTLAGNTARRVGRLAPTSGTLPMIGHVTAAGSTSGASLPFVAITEAAKALGEHLTKADITRLEHMIVSGNPDASARGLTAAQRRVMRAVMAAQQGGSAPARSDDFLR